MSSGTINTGTPIEHGGTGKRTRAEAINNLLFSNLLGWQADGDVNNMRTTAIVQCSTGWSNIPGPWGFLFIIGSPYGTVQFYELYGNLYIREYRSESWNDWKQL